MKITLLGTGAAASTPERTTSAYYLEHQGRSILFDCGEGVLGLRPGQNVDLTGIEMLCLTHDHTDHLAGLVSLARRRARAKPKQVLEIYGSEQAIKKARSLIEAEGSLTKKQVRYIVAFPGSVIQREYLRLTPFATAHTRGAMGFRVDANPIGQVFDPAKARALGVGPGSLMQALKNGETVTIPNGSIVRPADVMTGGEVESMAYTGDTQISKEVVEAVRGVDVLIHDCTYLFKDKFQAAQHAHSTTVHAGKVGK